mmetsp:Transcript_10408/g.27038  ORF Transcript_10408/g.27038 Transcript_10408/m.27038 type:complete len:148 (-) Transcript_10408:148-591(-)|eukprot:CAMPEP_0119416044 /NCGR_PEP_ID=MMETSP1335-20130426/11457_1 /TAXON_ID=259385 /ORGANISM="Chrysoculter rhomboideus, Strain RCC1486" /LENGTH=147 /DNA_ID=CAMNT_0007441123 /DNA_START=39 /DNA_END=482 /DNA_ORIENTATION=-
MRIEDNDIGVVTDVEVSQLMDNCLRSAENAKELVNGERRTKPRAPQPGIRALHLLQEQTLTCFRRQSDKTEEDISAFLDEVEQLTANSTDPLTSDEKLQLIHNRPYALVHIFLIVNDCERRLGGMPGCRALQSVCRKHFPKRPATPS